MNRDGFTGDCPNDHQLIACNTHTPNFSFLYYGTKYNISFVFVILDVCDTTVMLDVTSKHNKQYRIKIGLLILMLF